MTKRLVTAHVPVWELRPKPCNFCGAKITGARYHERKSRPPWYCNGICREAAQKKKRLEGFWDNADKPSSDVCWLWKKSRNHRGYGKFMYHNASRVAYEIAHGQTVPDDIYVLHECDVPACVNPKHLFLGTPQDNVDDMIKKGRQRVMRGEQAPWCRLTDEQVREIVRRAKIGERHESIAKDFGTTDNYVGKLASQRFRKVPTTSPQQQA